MFLSAAGATHPGLRRPGNEDAAYVGVRLLLVADGMGGAAYGEVASAIVTHAVTYLDERVSPEGVAHDLPAAVEFAEQRLRRAVEQDAALDGMGTTLTALLLHDDVVALVHVGDSRAYRWHDGLLEQVSRDHSVVQLLVELGELTPAQAEVHPQRHVIVKALRGEGDAVTADVLLLPGVPGDRWLLCSDGVSDVVPDEVIAGALAQSASPQGAVDRLVDAALAGGGPDNITCIVADVRAGLPAAERSPVVLGAAAELDLAGRRRHDSTQPIPQQG
jgi:serine/threonine protein phosphatase PrpC